MATWQRRVWLGFFYLLPLIIISFVTALDRHAVQEGQVILSWAGLSLRWDSLFKWGAALFGFIMYVPVVVATLQRVLLWLIIPALVGTVTVTAAVNVFILSDPARAKIDQYRREAQVNPKDHGAYELLANAYLEAGKYDAAIKAFDKALGLTPDPAYVLHDRGLVNARAGHYEAALADLDRAMELRSDQKDFVAKTYNDRAVVSYYFQRYEQSARDAAQALAMGLEVAPEFLEALAKQGFPVPKAPAGKQDLEPALSADLP